MDETTTLLRESNMSSRGWTTVTLRRFAAGAAVAAVATLGVLSSPEATRRVQSALGLTPGQTRYILRTRCMSSRAIQHAHAPRKMRIQTLRRAAPRLSAPVTHQSLPQRDTRLASRSSSA